MKTGLSVVALAVVGLFSTFGIAGQTSCESNSAILDDLVSKAQNQDLVFVIARLGAGVGRRRPPESG